MTTADQPDYTDEVAITVVDTPAPIDVNVQTQASPVTVTFPSTQDVNVKSQTANVAVDVKSMPASSTVAVASMPTSSGVQIKGQDAALTTTPSEPVISGLTASYENAAFVTGASPATHDVNNDLSRNAHDGYIYNGGSGNLKFQVSNDGTNFGGTHTLKAGCTAILTHLDIDTIKVTWVANTEYYIMVV